MAQNDFFKRYLDAALEFTDMTQSRAEALVKDLVNAGEVQADQARETVSEFLERSRKSSERLMETVREEVKAQIANLGLAEKADIERMEQRLRGLFGNGTTTRRTTGAESTAKKAASSTKRKASGAKKTATEKAAAKKTAAKRTTKATAAKKSTAKKSTAKRSTAKKSTARRA